MFYCARTLLPLISPIAIPVPATIAAAGDPAASHCEPMMSSKAAGLV
jgi:hypothetical protein